MPGVTKGIPSLAHSATYGMVAFPLATGMKYERKLPFRLVTFFADFIFWCGPGQMEGMSGAFFSGLRVASVSGSHFLPHSPA